MSCVSRLAAISNVNLQISTKRGKKIFISAQSPIDLIGERKEQATLFTFGNINQFNWRTNCASSIRRYNKRDADDVR